MLPVPKYPQITTPYLKRGPLWSGGVHKGVDFAARAGTEVRAPWDGRVIGIGIWGSAFGSLSPVIDFDRLPDGSPGRWGVLAHLNSCSVRVGDRVQAGQRVGTVGRRGNATGPHLHLEVHTAAHWTQNGHCSPKEHLRAGGANYLQGGRVRSSRMAGPGADGRPVVTDSDSVRNLQIALKRLDPDLDWPVTGNYGVKTRKAVRAFQRSRGWSGADADGIAGPGTVRALGLTWLDDGAPPTFDRGTCALLERAVAAADVDADFRAHWDDPAIRAAGDFTPSYVMLHHTGGTDSLAWIEEGANGSRVPRANVLVDRDGRVHVVSGFQTAHAGKGGPLGEVGVDLMNHHSFGVEVESQGLAPDFTDAQMAAVVALARALLAEMGSEVDHVVNHRTWSSTGKTDTLYDDSYWRVALLQNALFVSERTLGPDDPGTFAARSDLAAAYRSAGRVDEAIPQLERLLADRDRVLGADHAQALVARTELAAAYQGAGRVQDALPLLERARGDGERILGAQHPDTLAAGNELAGVLRLVGRRSEAITLLQRTLTDGEGALGPQFPLVGQIRANLQVTMAADQR